MADDDLCRAIGEDLVRHYPNHPWGVGVDLECGSITIELGYPHPKLTHATWGYRLHPATCMGPGGQAAVMRAGGELLERFNLARGGADEDSAQAATENGVIIGDTKDGSWLLKKRATAGG
jgi:hypothetical protein